VFFLQKKSIQETPESASSQYLQYKKSLDKPISKNKNNRLSKSGSPASLCTSIATQGRYQGQEHIYRADIQADDFIETGERDQPYLLRLSYDGEQSNLSHTDVMLIRAENRQRNEGCHSVATVQPYQNAPSGTSFTTAMGPEQLHASSSCTSLSTLAEGCYRGQGDLYQVGTRAEDLMAIEEQQRPHHPTLDKGRSTGMFSNLRSLTPS